MLRPYHTPSHKRIRPADQACMKRRTRRSCQREEETMRFFITGTSGFIGFHLARRLLREGHDVTGFDGMTQYYSVRLKQARVAELERFSSFTSVVGMLEDQPKLSAAWRDAEPDIVVHLAAQAGVRYSLENPKAYLDANLLGSWNILELAKETQVRAPDDGLDLFRLRRQPYRSVLRIQQHGRAADILRGNEEGGGGHRPQLRSHSQDSRHGVPLLHGLRSFRPPRHGAAEVREGDPGRRGDRGLRARPDEPRLHLCRRSGGGDRSAVAPLPL